MSLLIKKEGIFTSLQGLGRFGMQRFGVPPGGAMDPTAARLANLLVGNDGSALTLEFHFPGPEIRFEERCMFALCGADFGAQLDGRDVANWCVHEAYPPSELRFPVKITGSRAYLSVRGGFGAAPGGAVDGFRTRPLRAGQRLRPASAGSGLNTPAAGAVSPGILPAYSSSATVRVVAGSEYQFLDEKDKEVFETTHFVLSADSNRMGFRLNGPALHLSQHAELVSSAAAFGTIQLLPDGGLIVLMADHQATGGYPRVAHVISADLSLAAQLGPGDKIAFHRVSIDDAERAALALESDLNRLRTAIGFGRYW